MSGNDASRDYEDKHAIHESFYGGATSWANFDLPLNEQGVVPK